MLVARPALVARLALVALTALLAVKVHAEEAFDPRFAASRSLHRSLASRTAPVESFETGGAVIVEEDIYGTDSTDDSEEVAAFATATAESPCGPGWKLLWNDEFKFDGKLDNKAWSYLQGNGSDFGLVGWGNQEMQTYTKSSKNVRVSKGALNLIARREGNKVTSGAVRTFKKVAVTPKKNSVIRVDVTARFPRGTGLAPFVEMLPNDSPSNVLGSGHYGDWAQSGAIINAQRVNSNKGYTGGILYGGVSPNVAASTFEGKSMKDPTGVHTYSFEWSLSSMKWYLDAKRTFKTTGWYTNDTGKLPKGAPFDRPFYMMIGLAVGGDQTGATPAQVLKTLKKPQTFKIEYLQICESV
jgi:beta-glucanase (GH16 family)